jgi:predicted signal transduction protein with EAL and GGDEF domain
MYPDDATTGDGLLSAADSAMYLDKQRRPGKNRRIAAQRDREMSPENLA